MVGVAWRGETRASRARDPGHGGQHIGDLAHVEGGLWCGLVILRHIQLFYLTTVTRTGQVQFFEGAVEYQRDSDVVLTKGVTGFWLPPVLTTLKWQVKKSWGLVIQQSSKGTSEGSSKTNEYGDTAQCPVGMV